MNKPLTHKKTEFLYKDFPIGSVCRSDLEGEGFDISNVTDEDMEELASKMHETHLDSFYWQDMKQIGKEDLKIPLKKD